MNELESMACALEKHGFTARELCPDVNLRHPRTLCVEHLVAQGLGRRLPSLLLGMKTKQGEPPWSEVSSGRCSGPRRTVSSEGKCCMLRKGPGQLGRLPAGSGALEQGGGDRRPRGLSQMEGGVSQGWTSVLPNETAAGDPRRCL